LFLLLLPGKESDSLIKFVFGSTWNFPVSDDSDGLREEWFNCFNFHCTYVYASFKYFMSVLSVQKLFARLCYYILSCILLVVSGHLGTWTSRYWTYATSRYWVLDISVIDTGHLGTWYWKFRYWIIKIIWLNLKTFWKIFSHVDVVYTNFYVFFFNHL
jgi:hypothetical protein